VTEIGETAARVVIDVPGSAPAQLEISWAARSDVGLKRAANEDSFIARVPVFAVADGMGGHLAGDRASDAVVSRFAEISGDFSNVVAIEQALRLATADIAVISDGSDLGVGTTVTGAFLAVHNARPQFVVFNIGDSRVYLLRSGELEQVSVDHSLVQELVNAGRISAAEAIGHPDSNVITRAVGFEDNPSVDTWILPVDAGLRLLICSDGLTGEVTDSEIKGILAAESDPVDVATALVDAALASGARDNVTVVVIDAAIV